jgi:hypothetical protein
VKAVTLAAAALLVLGGCAAAHGGSAVRRVEIPVARGCVPESLPPAPLFADSAAALLGASGADERYRLLAAEWLRRAARLEMLEAVVEACR